MATCESKTDKAARRYRPLREPRGRPRRGMGFEDQWRVASGEKTRIDATYCNAHSERGGVNDQPGFLAPLGMTDFG